MMAGYLGFRATCAAKTPSISMQPPIVWQFCGAPAVAEYYYRCEYGHERPGTVCDDHRPVPGDLGCAQCAERGANVPMIPRHLRELCPESKMDSGAHSLEWDDHDLCSWCGHSNR